MHTNGPLRPRERQTGPVTMRRAGVRPTTADQRLLDSHLREDWKTKDAWRALRILSESDCRAVLDMAAAIDIQAEAFSLLAAGKSVEGLRSFASSEDPPGVAIFNPCFLRGGAGYGIKVISDFYDNEKRGIVRMSGLVCLFEGDTGRPYTVLEAGYLTDLRTGL